MTRGAEFPRPPRRELQSKPTRIGRGPQGPFGKLIRKVVTDALAIKKKAGWGGGGGGEKRSYHRTLKKKSRQFYCCQILSFQWARCKAGEVWGGI